MTVRLTPEKCDHIRASASAILNKPTITIMQLAEFIGQLVASVPGVHQAPLHYKLLEIERDAALKGNHRNYNTLMSLSHAALEQVNWWRCNIGHTSRSLKQPSTNYVIQSDSSDYAWGGHFEGKLAGGPWTVHEATKHINYKELLAAFLTLQSFCKDMSNVHIHVQ